ncbi:MAG: GNAT family N-acetyltransferase [Bacillus sp. (in: Bacteria)]|nr:GNAT family N-acetyltransferase [Bacillus sp. (in: firmicutes)]
MVIETERLWLVPCIVANLKEYDYPIGPHKEEYLANPTNNSALDGWGPWIVVEKSSNSAIGDMGFKGPPSKEQTVEIGYGIAPEQQNKGYATEGMKGLIEWAFSFDNIDTIKAECLNDNTPSIRVLEKLDMTLVCQGDGMLYWHRKK